MMDKRLICFVRHISRTHLGLWSLLCIPLARSAVQPLTAKGGPTSHSVAV